MRRLMTVGVACAALAACGAAGCGDDEDDGGGQAAAPAATTEAPAAETETEASSSGSERTITVTIKDFAFTPAEVDARVGDTVKWVNEDSAPHNAVEEGGDLRTSTFERGGSDTYTLDEAGTIDYICTVHPQMKGKIVVAAR